MLKIHQRVGLITTIPLVATVILGPGAGGKSEGTTTRDLHVALGVDDPSQERNACARRHDLAFAVMAASDSGISCVLFPASYR